MSCQHPLLEAQMAAARVLLSSVHPNRWSGGRVRAGPDRSVCEERNPWLMREREMLEGCRRSWSWRGGGREGGGGFCCCDVSRLLQHGAPELKSQGHYTVLLESGPAAALGPVLDARASWAFRPGTPEPPHVGCWLCSCLVLCLSSLLV